MIKNAEHAETSPDASTLLISQLSCSLAGETETIILKPATLACQIYHKETITEAFACNYGLNPEYQHLFSSQNLIIAGTNADAEIRLMELSGHRFFMATLFLPQLSSLLEKPHPIIVAYLKAASEKSS